MLYIFANRSNVHFVKEKLIFILFFIHNNHKKNVSDELRLISFKIDASLSLSLSLMGTMHCARETNGKSVKLIGSGKKRTFSPDRKNNHGIHLPTASLKDASSHWESHLTAAPEVVSERRQNQRNTTHWIYVGGVGGGSSVSSPLLSRILRESTTEWEVWIDRMILR